MHVPQRSAQPKKLALSLLRLSVDNAASRILFGCWSLPVYVIATALSSFRFLVSVARRMSAFSAAVSSQLNSIQGQTQQKNKIKMVTSHKKVVNSNLEIYSVVSANGSFVELASDVAIIRCSVTLRGCRSLSLVSSWSEY